jgi:hypothetical protein
MYFLNFNGYLNMLDSDFNFPQLFLFDAFFI